MWKNGWEISFLSPDTCSIEDTEDREDASRGVEEEREGRLPPPINIGSGYSSSGEDRETDRPPNNRYCLKCNRGFGDWEGFSEHLIVFHLKKEEPLIKIKRLRRERDHLEEEKGRYNNNNNNYIDIHQKRRKIASLRVKIIRRMSDNGREIETFEVLKEPVMDAKEPVEITEKENIISEELKIDDENPQERRKSTEEPPGRRESYEKEGGNPFSKEMVVVDRPISPSGVSDASTVEHSLSIGIKKVGEESLVTLTPRTPGERVRVRNVGKVENMTEGGKDVSGGGGTAGIVKVKEEYPESDGNKESPPGSDPLADHQEVRGGSTSPQAHPGSSSRPASLGGIAVRSSAELMAPTPLPPLVNHREPFAALQGMVSDIQPSNDSNRSGPLMPPTQMQNHHGGGGGSGSGGYSVVQHQQQVPLGGGGGGSQQQQAFEMLHKTHPNSLNHSPSPLSSIPVLPPGVQVSKRMSSSSSGLQQSPASAPLVKQRRLEESQSNGGNLSPGVKLPDSITLSRPGVSITPSSSSSSTSSTSSSNSSVADMLATRGITVVPTSGGPRSQNQTSSLLITKTNMPSQINSAVSIMPARGTPRRGGSAGGASRLPTIDLTSETSRAPMVPQPKVLPMQAQHQQQQQQASSPGGGIMRGPRAAMNRAKVTCQVCDKIFASPEALSVHMQTHKQGGGMPNSMRNQGTSRLPVECNICTARYPTPALLAAHKAKYHQGDESSEELAIIVVNVLQPGIPQRLSSMGVKHVVPLVQLNKREDGVYCIPLVGVDSTINGNMNNIAGLGACNLLPLGQLRKI